MGEEDSQPGQLTRDPAIAPGGVFAGRPEDDRYGSIGNARPPWSVGFGPASTDQVPMPAEQGPGLDEEPLPTSTIKQPTQPGEQCSIRGLQYRSGHLTTKDGDLVAKYDDLDRQFVARSCSTEVLVRPPG
jgi:hypothetical protein